MSGQMWAHSQIAARVRLLQQHEKSAAPGAHCAVEWNIFRLRIDTPNSSILNHRLFTLRSENRRIFPHSRLPHHEFQVEQYTIHCTSSNISTDFRPSIVSVALNKTLSRFCSLFWVGWVFVGLCAHSNERLNYCERWPKTRHCLSFRAEKPNESSPPFSNSDLCGCKTIMNPHIANGRTFFIGSATASIYCYYSIALPDRWRLPPGASLCLKSTASVSNYNSLGPGRFGRNIKLPTRMSTKL